MEMEIGGECYDNPVFILTLLRESRQPPPNPAAGSRQRQVVSDTLPPTLAAHRTSEHQINRSYLVENVPVRLSTDMQERTTAFIDFKERPAFDTAFQSGSIVPWPKYLPYPLYLKPYSHVRTYD